MPTPLVTLHYAQTLDGRIATCTGSSQWISGPEALVFAHQLRASHDAVLVGIGTILRDNPQLTVRHIEGVNPLRVVVDSRLRLPKQAAVLHDGAASGTLVGTTGQASVERQDQIRALGAAVEALRTDPSGRVDLHHLLERLGTLGVRSVLVEGGGRIITSLLALRLVDRLVACIAPKILGSGVDAVGDLRVRDLSGALTFREYTVERLGDDLIFDGLLERGVEFQSVEPWYAPARSG